MKSRIFSSKHLKTISKGQSWIPAFITLGFLLAFPVTGMVTVSYTHLDVYKRQAETPQTGTCIF